MHSAAKHCESLGRYSLRAARCCRCEGADAACCVTHTRCTVRGNIVRRQTQPSRHVGIVQLVCVVGQTSRLFGGQSSRRSVDYNRKHIPGGALHLQQQCFMLSAVCAGGCGRRCVALTMSLSCPSLLSRASTAARVSSLPLMLLPSTSGWLCWLLSCLSVWPRTRPTTHGEHVHWVGAGRLAQQQAPCTCMLCPGFYSSTTPYLFSALQLDLRGVLSRYARRACKQGSRSVHEHQQVPSGAGSLHNNIHQVMPFMLSCSSSPNFSDSRAACCAPPSL